MADVLIARRSLVLLSCIADSILPLSKSGHIHLNATGCVAHKGRGRDITRKGDIRPMLRVNIIELS